MYGGIPPQIQGSDNEVDQKGYDYESKVASIIPGER